MLLVYGSPRAGGNSELLLDALAQGAAQAGVVPERIYLREHTYQGCTACGCCETTGRCVLKDDMEALYAPLARNRLIVLGLPIFFYGPPAIAKAFIDRAQAEWCARALARPRAEWAKHMGGTGYLLAVGATSGDKLFMPTELICKYFFDALDMDYGGGMFFRNLDAKGAVLQKPDLLKNVRQWGKHLAEETL